MKRKKTAARAALLCAAVLMTGIMTGCGNTGKESGESTQQESGQGAGNTGYERVVLKDLDVDKYVTLGDYRSLRVEKAEAVVNEDDLQELLNEVYINSFPESLGVKDRAVEEGDSVNIDFEGKKDGVAFDGGTAQGYNLTVGSHSFIDGFEEGLVGVMPGETLDLNLKFPDVYPNNPDLAGQDVAFTVTVNYIIPAEKMDEAVTNFGVAEVTNLEELRQYIYDYLYSYMENEVAVDYEEEVLDAFLALCEFKEIPQEYFESFREATRQNIISVAASYGLDPDTYINYSYGMTLEAFLNVYADESLKQNIAMQAVANKEGLAVDDDELNELLQQYAASAGYDTVEEYVGDASPEDFREYIMYDKVYNYLMETAAKTD